MKEQKAFQASDATYKAIFNSVNDAIFIHDPDTGAIQDVNAKVTEMFGYTADEALKLTVEDISSGIPPYNLEGAVDKIRAAVENRGTIFEWNTKKKSGRLFWVEVNLKPININNKLSVVAVVRDITERKQAQEAQEKMKHVLTEGQKITHMGTFEYNADTRTTVWSEEEYRIYGLDPSQPSPAYDIMLAKSIHPDDASLLHRTFTDAMSSGSIYELEHRIVRPDGSVRWVYDRAHPHFGQDGRLVRYVGATLDITERKQAEGKLQEHAEKLAAANQELKRNTKRFELLSSTAAKLLQTSDPQMLIESLCLEVMEFLDCQAFFNFLVDEESGRLHLNACAGIPEDEVRKIEWLDYGVAVCGCVARDGHRIVAENILTTPDERTELVKSYGIRSYACHPLLGAEGKVIGTLSFGSLTRDAFNDVDLSTMKAVADLVATAMLRMRSEIEVRRHRDSLGELVKNRTMELEEKTKKLENEIVEKEKAEAERRKVETQLAQSQRIEALDRFAGGIAHDLNNILYPIIINTEELLAEESDGSARHEILSQTLKAAYRQRDLVKKILSFSRRSEQVRQPVRVRPLLQETVKFLRSSLPSTIEIRQSIQAKIDTIMGDPIQIQQVIMNLCKNAADAMESDKGIIEIELSNTYMKPMHPHQDIQAGDYIKLTVRDSGVGMNAEVMDRAFEPFFTKKDVGKGTGLGLPVVHGIVRSHGGMVTVESEEGKGSLFTVYLPISHAELNVHVSDAENLASLKGKENILLVDDEEIILSSLQRVLRSSGYRVTALRDGQLALREFSENPDEFNLVITDLTMPGMTGLELTRKLHDVRSDIPVVLCTGFNDVISQEEAKSFGIKELLLKPVGAGELKKVIHRALEQ